ncbi:MAG: alpha/beta hydrolase [Drouetiella hepatica Uher 2000/2452]|uniref:Alpha/beta hydrolase n=1 Tax=Drouetiella hepatica Uher 2000/2452 TaxID=904376 RepID=A0A951UMX8_9CYAN|nr:alpha/beta hydrolase [Drouetiella hepatica Uher 2000/2452]
MLNVSRMKSEFIQSVFIRAVGLLLGAIASLLCSVGRADAAETVILNYLDTRIPVSNQEFLEFANGTEVSDNLQAYFQKVPLTPDEARRLLNEPIVPKISLRLNSNLNEFLALQLNHLMGEPYGRESLDALETVVISALADDDSFSILKLIDKYPESDVKVYLGRLDRVHSDVSLFVERVQPILQQSDGLLEDLVCDCGVESGPALMSSTPADLPTASAKKLFEAYQSSQIDTLSLLASLPKLKGFQANFSKPMTGTMASARAKETPLLVQASSDYTPPQLAQEIVVKYGPLRRSLSIADLTTLAETGKPSRSLKSLLGLAKVSPENVQTLLNRSVKVDATFLDKNLRNVLGEFALFEVGQIVQTGSGKANIQALRSALILSARDDNHVTFLEFLQNYPLPQMYVDGMRLARLARLVAASGGARGLVVNEAQNLEDFLVNVQAAIAKEVCNCENQPAG